MDGQLEAVIQLCATRALNCCLPAHVCGMTTILLKVSVNRTGQKRASSVSAQQQPPQKVGKPYQGPDCQAHLMLGMARGSVEDGGQTRGQLIQKPSQQSRHRKDNSVSRIQAELSLLRDVSCSITDNLDRMISIQLSAHGYSLLGVERLWLLLSPSSLFALGIVGMQPSSCKHHHVPTHAWCDSLI